MIFPLIFTLFTFILLAARISLSETTKSAITIWTFFDIVSTSQVMLKNGIFNLRYNYFQFWSFPQSIGCIESCQSLLMVYWMHTGVVRTFDLDPICYYLICKHLRDPVQKACCAAIHQADLTLKQRRLVFYRYFQVTDDTSLRHLS